MSQDALIEKAKVPSLSKAQLKNIVRASLEQKRAVLPDSVQSLDDFLISIGLTNYERGLESLSASWWRSHTNKYGFNQVNRRLRLRCRCSNMPFFYGFLLLIVAGVTVADNLLYEYEYWYIQGASMLLMVLIAALVFGCGRVRTSKLQAQQQQEAPHRIPSQVAVTRDGVQSFVMDDQLTVGDKIQLGAGDNIPADCALAYIDPSSEFLVSEVALTGEPDEISKKSLGHFNSLNLSQDTIVFSGSSVVRGNAYGIVLAVGDYSLAADTTLSLDNKEDQDEDNDLLDKHWNILQVLITVLIMASALALVQCSISADIDWQTSANIALMMFVYGFPYILAIPSIWDIALRNTARQLKEGNVAVQNMDTIEEVASLDYLCIQTISVLDNKDEMEKYKRCIARLQQMGVKVILATGIPEADARAIAIETGILKKEHEKICGAVIEGSDLRKIFNGRKTNLGFDITPEYLSVVYRASAEDRCVLVDYLARLHPGRSSANSPQSFSSEDFKVARPVATVGAIGSGKNDIGMLKKASIAFSTFIRSDDDAQAAADMVLLKDSLADVVHAVTKGRSYKDHLMKFILLQVPASLSGIGLVLSQVFLYDTILVTACFIFLINLIYFPIAIACIVRENAASRYPDMIGRWRSVRYPGTKTITGYMKSEYLKFSIFINTVYQLGAMAALYYEAEKLFTLVHEDLDWHKDDPIFVDQAWLAEHAAIAPDYELNDLTDKGKMFLIIFQTFAYLQIFGILNARRPSFKDLNPFEGISVLTCVTLVVLLGFQFSICYVPSMFGYGTIDWEAGLICMGVGAVSVIWFTFWKVVLRFVLGGEDLYPEQA